MNSLPTLLSLALAFLALDPSLEVRDVYGRRAWPFRVADTAQVLFFLSAECPISRFYAQEIQSICKDYGTRGVTCALVYEDQPVDVAAVRAHVREFEYSAIPVMTDGTGRIAVQGWMSCLVVPQNCPSPASRVMPWTPSPSTPSTIC